MWRLLLICSLVLSAACERIPRDAEGTPMLHHAASGGDLAQIERLLGAGTPVNVRDVCQRTPLMMAAQAGQAEAVARLLAAGADVNLHEKGHYTALMLAAAQGHTAIVQRLAAAGADINDVEKTNGWTALIWAAQQGHADTVAALLALGVDAQLRGHDGRSARDWALANGHGAVLGVLDAPLTDVNATRGVAVENDASPLLPGK